MERIRVIQVGAGGFGRSWMEVVAGYPETELAAVVDIMPENLDKARQITGLPQVALFASPDEAFRSVRADMVLVVTPPPTHKDIAIRGLNEGLHVLLEKPLTHTYDEALELLAASRKFPRRLAVSQNYRWRPPVQTVKQLLREEAVGKVGYVEFEFRKAMRFGGWRDQYQEILLEDMAIHHFDMLRYLLGEEPAQVYAESFRPAWSWFSGKPSAAVSITFGKHIRAHYFGSWVSRGKETAWNGDLRIVGERGAIEMIDDEVWLWEEREDRQPEGRQVRLIDMPYGDRASSLDDFVRAIREGRAPSSSIEDNIRSFELTCAAIRSAQTETKIRMSEFSRIG